MRGVILRGEDTERGKPVGVRGAEAVGRLLDCRYPVFHCNAGYGPFVARWTRNWDAFILSWAQAQAALRDYDRAGNEEEMAEMLEEYGMMEVIEGETVDAFNERLWQTEVEDMMDCLSEDFDALAERLAVARTIAVAQGVPFACEYGVFP